MKKKRKSNTPRHKRMKREARLQSAKHWIPKYEGKNIIKGYSKHFAVDKLCAIKELEILGLEFKPEYIKQVKESLMANEKVKQQRKLRKKQEESLNTYMDSDENFYFIVGYTSGGAPYGITWDQAIKDGLIEDDELIDRAFDYSWLGENHENDEFTGEDVEEEDQLVDDFDKIPF